MNYFVAELCDAWVRMVREGRNRHVRVNEEKLEEVATEWAKLDPDKDVPAPAWHFPNIEPENNPAFVSKLLYESAVNFAFTLFEPPHPKYKVADAPPGATSMARCFYRRFGESPVRAEEMLEITETPESIRQFFQGDNLPPLLEERRLNLREVASVMLEDFNDDAMQLLEWSEYRAIRNESGKGGLVENLALTFPLAFGRDHFMYRHYFHKRNQLFALMYHGRALDSKGELPLLKDPERIGPVIDYQLPRFHRYEGILIYSEDLARLVDNQVLIKRHSDMEMEIRCASMYVAAKKQWRINEIRATAGLKPWTMLNQDFKEWSGGRKLTTNHHLCQTTDY